MSKKKFDGILKGLAAAGVVTGGVGIVQDTDVVFALEIDNATTGTTPEQQETQPGTTPEQ